MTNELDKQKKKIIFFLLIPVSLLILYFSTMTVKSKKNRTLPFGKDSWALYKEKHEKYLKKRKVRSVKIIFFTKSQDGTLHYVVSLKRHDKRKSKKDGRYEFPGGKVDKKEKVLAALRRETKEEDDSLILYRQLKYIIELKPKFLRYKLIRLKDRTLHAVFLLPLKAKQWKELEKYYQENNPENSETYGFERINLSYFNLTQEMKGQWTPQTIRILKALQKSKIKQIG